MRKKQHTVRKRCAYKSVRMIFFYENVVVFRRPGIRLGLVVAVVHTHGERSDVYLPHHASLSFYLFLSLTISLPMRRLDDCVTCPVRLWEEMEFSSPPSPSPLCRADVINFFFVHFTYSFFLFFTFTCVPRVKEANIVVIVAATTVVY